MRWYVVAAVALCFILFVVSGLIDSKRRARQEKQAEIDMVAGKSC